MSSIINVSNLNVTTGNHSILKNINLEIPEKKITVLLGPSGCGKTTLLKCMNRLIDFDTELKVQGNIWFDGDDILNTRADLNQIRRKMGLLSQRPYPLPMSIFDNVAYGMKIHGQKNKKFISEHVEHHLKQVNLWDEVKNRLNEPASRLSIGQQQRLCLARGLAVEPQIILADEPTSALDPLSSNAIEKKFIELKQDYSLIIVTHILRQARRLGDYIVFMYLGEIIEQGTKEEFFNNPQQEKTKAYLEGSIN